MSILSLRCRTVDEEVAVPNSRADSAPPTSNTADQATGISQLQISICDKRENILVGFFSEDTHKSGGSVQCATRF